MLFGENFLVGHVLCAHGSLFIPEGLVEALGWSLLPHLIALELCQLHHGKIKFTVGLIEFVATNALVAVVKWVCEWVAVAASLRVGSGVLLG